MLKIHQSSSMVWLPLTMLTLLGCTAWAVLVGLNDAEISALVAAEAATLAECRIFIDLVYDTCNFLFFCRGHKSPQVQLARGMTRRGAAAWLEHVNSPVLDQLKDARRHGKNSPSGNSSMSTPSKNSAGGSSAGGAAGGGNVEGATRSVRRRPSPPPKDATAAAETEVALVAFINDAARKTEMDRRKNQLSALRDAFRALRSKTTDPYFDDDNQFKIPSLEDLEGLVGGVEGGELLLEAYAHCISPSKEGYLRRVKERLDQFDTYGSSMVCDDGDTLKDGLAVAMTTGSKPLKTVTMLRNYLVQNKRRLRLAALFNAEQKVHMQVRPNVLSLHVI